MAGRLRRLRSGGQVPDADRLPLDRLLTLLGTTAERGLPPQEAARRLQRDGPNEIPSPPRATLFGLAWQQVRSVMTLVLLLAMTLSFALGEWLDGWAVLAIAALNVLLGMAQEYRAEKAMQAIARISAPVARVIRSGAVRSVPVRQLVVGDVVWLEAGDRVPADCRLLHSFALAAEESVLTGESVPVPKWPCDDPAQDPRAAERPHLVLMGTTITSGHARGVVVRTGAYTELGHLAALVLEAPSRSTPLQENLEHLARWLVLISAAAVGLVFAVGVAHGQPWLDMLFVAVTLAVAAIPEGLPAAVTVALAVGVLRMSRRGAIVRRLSAVETLGCTSTICSDKTGTLTRNEMMVSRIWAAWGQLQVSGHGFAPVGEFREGERLVHPAASPLWRGLFVALASSCQGDVVRGDGGRWEPVGDPTEAALACAVHKAGLRPRGLPGAEPVAEAPFEAQRRMMSVAVAPPGAALAHVYVKGAPDAVLDKSRRIRMAGSEAPLDGRWRARIAAEADRMAREGLRVLAVARAEVAVGRLPDRSAPVSAVASVLERDLTFLGLVGLFDPPRPDAGPALEAARRAGVRTLMVTGDHPQTAMAVALAIGLADPDETPVLGSEMAGMTDAELQEVALRRHVFARVPPSEKRRLVRVLRQMGQVVAMTGDGVNDAPALKEADIGVAMGRTGTDLARQAASMVLAEDNYASIVEAIREGRGIYDNIRGFIRYLLGCNVGELLAMLGAGVLGLPVPLTPLQILWVNLVTDGLPALALGVLPAPARVMRRAPRPRHESLFARGVAEEIVEEGLLIGSSTLLLFGLALGAGLAIERARTLAFSALVASQLLYALACGAESGTALRSLKLLLGAVGLSWAMQLAVLGLVPLQPLFGTVWPRPGEWAFVAAASVGAFALRHGADLLCRWLGQTISRMRAGAAVQAAARPSR